MIYSVSTTHSKHLWQVAAGGREPVRIELAGAMASDPTISRGGNRAAFQRSNINADVWKMDERGAFTNVIGSNLTDYSADYSPDGSKIVYASPQGETLDLWTANSDGTGQSPLTNGRGASQGSPRWSPDGKWIVFDSYDATTGVSQVWLVGSNGGPPRQLTHTPAGLTTASMFISTAK